MDIDQLISEKPLLHTDENGRPVDYSINILVLKALKKYLKPGMNTLETGSGLSTIVFATIGTHHFSISPYADEQVRIKNYLDQKGIGSSTIFLNGSSDYVLPNATDIPELLDFVLIDGAHRYPFASIDFHYTEYKILVGGILCVDDVHMPSVKILYNFLKNEKEWELIEKVKNTAFFKRVALTNIYSDWQGQEMNRRFKFISTIKGKISKPIKRLLNRF